MGGSVIAGIGNYALENGKMYYAPPSTKVPQMLFYLVVSFVVLKVQLFCYSCKRCSQHEASSNCEYF